MKIVPNDLYEPLFTGNHRYVICMGGRSSGRSYSASQYALLKLMTAEYFRCAIMRLVLSDIRNSIFQEIRDRIEENELENHIKIKEDRLTFEFGGNKINGIGFRKSSGDQKSKLKSLANYNCIIIEEADEISEEDFMQLDDSLRTVKSDIKIIFMLNPPHKNHWIIKRWFNLLECGVDGFYRAVLKSTATDTCYIHGTYQGNRANINQTTISNFENYRLTRPDHYHNMIKGLISEGARGRIFKNWKVIPDAEFEALPYASFYALDFGFTNDPTALVEIKTHNDTVWFRELIYEAGLTNQVISKRMEQLGVSKSAPIYADSAEPKSIAELQVDDWNVIASMKGADSIRAGIDLLLQKQIWYNESSINIPIEVQEYCWALNKDKEPLNEPIDKFNHLMDALRYGVYTNSVQGFVGFV